MSEIYPQTTISFSLFKHVSVENWFVHFKNGAAIPQHAHFFPNYGSEPSSNHYIYLLSLAIVPHPHSKNFAFSVNTLTDLLSILPALILFSQRIERPSP